MRESQHSLQDMDVTYTNVLEGARQYFQGLPAATDTATVPTQQQQPPRDHLQAAGYAQQATAQPAENPHPPYMHQGYWPQEDKEQKHIEMRPPTHNNIPQQPQQHNESKVIQNYQQHYQQNQYQYPRIVENTHYQQQVHQNTNYQQVHPNINNTVQVNRQATRPEQQKNYQPKEMYVNGYQPYYPPHSKPQSPAAPPSSQAYQHASTNQYTSQSYTIHSQSPVQTQTQYLSTKPVETYNGDKNEYMRNHRTHNLPPIAALSSVNYHSKTSREVPRIQPVQRQRTQSYVATSNAPSNVPSNVPSTVYQNTQQRPAIYTQTQRSNSFSNQTYVNVSNQDHRYFPAVSAAYTNTASTSTSKYPSSYPQYFQKTEPLKKDLLQQQQQQQQLQQQQQQQQQQVQQQQQQPRLEVQRNDISTIIAEATNPKQKRESPLDLSVKTVRTFADSTLDDIEADRFHKAFKARLETKYQQNGNYVTEPRARSYSIATTGAPKVDFLPNFSAPALHTQQNHETQYHYKQSDINQANYRQNYQVPNQNIRQTYQVQNDKELPRFDFPNDAYKKTTVAPQNVRKRSTDSPNAIPNKITKVDSWRASIDLQIEQRLSSYANSRLQQEQYKNVQNVQFVKPNTQQKYVNQQNYYQNQQYRTESQTYVPEMQQYYPPNNQNQYDMYVNLQRSNSTSKLNQISPKPTGGAADKRILSILRNSLEIKGAKEAQKKLDQTISQNMQTGVQHPTTDVTAPLQPKPGIHGRHNVSPFTAASLLERNSNTPPSYKFHFPRAVDSVKFESDTLIKEDGRDGVHLYPSEDKMTASGNCNTPPMGASTGTTDLDGLAAFLAQRIRTKAELKQVTEEKEEKIELEVPVPPKLNRELQPSRKKLFSKSEEEINGLNVPRTALRSSSETSVFDFRDSDSEGEMPVLERQSLEDMRRDRKSHIKPQPVENIELIDDNLDLDWAETCNKFMEQLQNNSGKKRGRRKKMVEPDVLAKLESVTKENPLPENSEINSEINSEMNSEIIVKQEILDEEDIKIEPEICITPVIKQEIIEEPEKIDNDSDSDVPLNQIRRPVIKKENDFSEDEEVTILCKKTEKIGAKTRIEYSSDSDSDNTEKIESVSRKLFTKKSKKGDKQKMVLRSADSSPAKKMDIKTFLKKKAIYGDGSDFHPGWEEEVYRYKRSIRMPASLINVSRPHWHRMSTSLPDLDACSPAPSSITDEEFILSKTKLNSIEKLKKDILDSDSNSSFTKDEASGSKKTKKDSILDVLVERYSKFKKRKKLKDKKNGPKIIPKSSNLLLPTPSLGIGNEDSKEKTKKGKVKTKEESVENNSVYLGYFRKETVNNFREAFKKNSGFIGEPFSTIVLKSRTRTETRVMKQRATIREVFGEDRPASAPPMTCHEEDSQTSEKPEKSPTRNENKNKENKESIRSSLRSANSPKKTYMTKKRSTNLLKNINTEIKQEIDEQIAVKSETPSINGDEVSDASIPTKKRIKLTKMRRKFSSGFDYIRKKKKIIKKEDMDTSLKPKRRNLIPKQTPESEQDIQKEIKTWVMNKGVGETHLHRAARLGYTDVTAYCLEKMDCPPSPKDNAGYTPLHEACSRGHLEIARLLLRYGANVSDSAQGGIRPLHEAAENGYVEIIRLLLSYGADPNLATYSGLTPLALASDEDTKYILKNYVADMEGLPTPAWTFVGPASFFDNENSGFDPLDGAPSPEPEPDESDLELEISEAPLPNLYILRDEPSNERWILLQDLSAILKIKSRDTLLRQINPASTSTAANKSLIREMKFSEFIDKAHCCTLLCGNEKLSVRSTKIALVKYTDKVKKLLNVEKFIIQSEQR